MRPVVCFLREDLIDLYRYKGLIEDQEIPIINTDIFTLEDKIEWCYNNKHELNKIGDKGYEYVKKHHSIAAVGSVFHTINKRIDL